MNIPAELSHTSKRGLQDFARNGRWGTCGECPEDGDGRKLPELCSNTKRYDHWLDFASLVNLVQRQSLPVKANF